MHHDGCGLGWLAQRDDVADKEVAVHVTGELARVLLYAGQDRGAEVRRAARKVKGTLQRHDAKAATSHARQVIQQQRKKHLLAEASRRQGRLRGRRRRRRLGRGRRVRGLRRRHGQQARENVRAIRVAGEREQVRGVVTQVREQQGHLVR